MLSYRLERSTQRRESGCRFIIAQGSGIDVCLVLKFSPSIHEDNKAFLATLGEDHIPVPPDSSKITFIHPTYDSTKVIKDSWSIILIGTTPNSAGKGLGRKLVQLVLDRAGTEGRGVWVPTTLKARVSRLVQY